MKNMQYLLKKSCPKVWEQRKWGGEAPRHRQVMAVIEWHQVMVCENQLDGYLPCYNGTTKNLQTLWRHKRMGAPPADWLRQLTPGLTPPITHHWSGHSARVTRYHSNMTSRGERIKFINYKPALLPHQCPLGKWPSTTWSPPTLECCHSGSGVLIQFKYYSQYFLWIQMMNDSSHHHLYMKYLAIGIRYSQ
jgi:hypothetical protein